MRFQAPSAGRWYKIQSRRDAPTPARGYRRSPPMLLHQTGCGQEFFVVLVRDKTNLLALLFLSRLEAHAARHLTGLSLLQFTQRKHHMRQLLLPERKQKVSLILAGIPPAQHHRAAVSFFQPRIMAGGHVACAQFFCAVDQVAKLEFLVAHHARIRRAPGPVLRSEVINHITLKFLRLIDKIIRNAQLVRDGTGVHHRLRSATLVLRTRHAVLRPNL